MKTPSVSVFLFSLSLLRNTILKKEKGKKEKEGGQKF